MINRYRRLAYIIIAIGLLTTSVAWGQMVYGQKATLAARVIYQSWKLTSAGAETNLTQSAFPFGAYYPIRDNWEVRFNAAVSRSNLDDGRIDTKLTAFSGSSIRVYRSLATDRVFVSAGILLPSGADKLDTAEVLLNELISDDYLSTPVKQVVQGLGFVSQIGFASEVNPWLVLGASLSYNLNGTFTYVEAGGDYNPGDEVSLQGSATATSGETEVDFDLSYRHYMSDKAQDREVFKAGGVISALVAARHSFERFSIGGTVGHIIRKKNSVLFGSSLQAENQNSNSDKTVLSGGVTYKISPQVAAAVLFGYRALSANDYEASSTNFFGKSDVASYGFSLEYNAPQSRYSAFGRLMISNGKANKSAPEDLEIDVAGTEFSFGGRLSF